MIRHRIPDHEKDRKWRREFIRDIGNRQLQSFFDEKDLELLRASSGNFDHTKMTYVTNPYGMKDSRYTKYPAEFRNFDIITPLFKRLMALHSERNYDPIVYTKDSNFDSEQSEYETGLINEALQQRFVNALINSGQFDPMATNDIGQQVQPPMSPEVIRNQKSSMKDLVTIEGQHVLNYTISEQDIPEKLAKSWEMWIKLNKCLTYKDVRYDSVTYRNVTSRRVQYAGALNVSDLEDAEVIKVQYRFNYREVLEIFQDIFEADEYKEEYGDIAKQLEEEFGTVGTNSRGGAQVMGMNDVFTFADNYARNNGIGFYSSEPSIVEQGTILVEHVQGTSYRKIGKVWDEETQKIIDVTEDYLGDDVLHWEWQVDQREGYIINDKYEIGGYPLLFQRRDPDNPFYGKKSYNGKIFMKGEARHITLTEPLMYYQEAYNITKWKLQYTINKNKDKLVVMPIGLLGHFKNTSNTGGQTYYNGDLDDENQLKGQYNPNLTSEAETESSIAMSLYYGDTTQMLFVDETSENAQIAAQMIKEIDLSLGTQIQGYLSLLISIKSEAEEYVGFNRFATAGVNPSDTATSVRNGVYSASQVLEEHFTEFERFVNKEYQGILDLSAFAYRVGKKAQYVRNRTDVQVLQVTEALVKHVFGAFTKSGYASKEVANTLKMYVNEMIQNGVPVSAAARIISGTMNYSEIIQKLEELETIAQQQKAEEADRANKAMIQNTQLLEEGKDKDRQIDIYKIDMDFQGKLVDSNMEALSFAASNNNDSAVADLRKSQIDIMKLTTDVRLKFLQERNKVAKFKDDNKTKRYVADKTAYVARVNKN